MTDSAVCGGEGGGRVVIRVDSESFYIHPDARIEGDPKVDLAVTVPWLDAVFLSSPGPVPSRVVLPGKGWVIDSHAILTEAQATGRRLFRCADYRLPDEEASRFGRGSEAVPPAPDGT